MTSPVIVAVDRPTLKEAVELSARLSPSQCRLKIGKELFTAAGPAVVEALQARGFEIFLDLKFHDIPNTVAAACRVAAELGVWMVDVHASGGAAMLEAARAAVDRVTRPPLLVGITVLTSLADGDLAQIGLAGPIDQAVERLARLAQRSGLDGVVCSAAEAQHLRHVIGPDFVLVTPGIRPAGSAGDDQVRVVSPVDALRRGASWLVIGRPITQAADPQLALQNIIDSIPTP